MVVIWTFSLFVLRLRRQHSISYICGYNPTMVLIIAPIRIRGDSYPPSDDADFASAERCCLGGCKRSRVQILAALTIRSILAAGAS